MNNFVNNNFSLLQSSVLLFTKINKGDSSVYLVDCFFECTYRLLIERKANGKKRKKFAF